MASPGPHKTPVKHYSPRKGSPRSPQTPTYTVLPPSGKVPYKYAAGVLPITYTKNEATNALEWKILLCIELRSREARRCVHPLAGKKETFDEDDPVRTAVREFSEESSGVYNDFGTENEIRANLREDHTSWIYIPSSRMYFFYVYVPYRANVQHLFVNSAEKTSDGDELFWHPLDDFIAKNGRITHRWNNEDVLPSVCCQDWFNMKAFRDGFETAKSTILKRLELHNSPLAPAPSSTSTDTTVDALAATLASTSLASDSIEKKPEQDSSISSPPPPSPSNSTGV